MAKGPGGSLLAMTAPMKVEAEIPSGLLQNFRTAFDYGARTLTLSAPDNSRPQGIAVPLRVNPRTWCPASINSLTSSVPINPVDPVTNISIAISYSGKLRTKPASRLAAHVDIHASVF